MPTAADSQAAPETRPLYVIVAWDDDEERPVTSPEKPKEQPPAEEPAKIKSKTPSPVAPRPQYVIVGLDDDEPATPPENPKAPVEAEVSPEACPELTPCTPPTSSSPMLAEKMMNTDALATNQHQDAPKADVPRKAKPRRIPEPFTPPPDWAHVSGCLWKTEEGSPRHLCRKGTPAVFGLLKVRSRLSVRGVGACSRMCTTNTSAAIFCQRISGRPDHGSGSRGLGSDRHTDRHSPLAATR